MQYVTLFMSKKTFPEGKALFKGEGGVTLAIKKKSLIFKNCVSHTSVLYSVSALFHEEGNL